MKAGSNWRRIGEMLGNFVLPGVGTGLFAGSGRSGWWKPALLSALGLAISLAGAGLVVSLTGLLPSREHLERVFLGQPQNLWWLALGAGLTFSGGVLVLAGYFWSIGATVVRWRKEPG